MVGETCNFDASGSRKYLFLDMDGVVCINGMLRDQLLTRLHQIVEATGCLVVLSSDWRKTAAHRRLAATCLERYGVRLHGHTPVLPGTFVRPKEIIKWMRCFAAKGDVSFVAIDDRPLLSEEGGHLLRTHFVHTKPSIGIDAAAQQKSIEILNGGPLDETWKTEREAGDRSSGLSPIAAARPHFAPREQAAPGSPMQPADSQPQRLLLLQRDSPPKWTIQPSSQPLVAGKASPPRQSIPYTSVRPTGQLGRAPVYGNGQAMLPQLRQTFPQPRAGGAQQVNPEKARPGAFGTAVAKSVHAPAVR